MYMGKKWANNNQGDSERAKDRELHTAGETRRTSHLRGKHTGLHTAGEGHMEKDTWDSTLKSTPLAQHTQMIPAVTDAHGGLKVCNDHSLPNIMLNKINQTYKNAKWTSCFRTQMSPLSHLGLGGSGLRHEDSCCYQPLKWGFYMGFTLGKDIKLCSNDLPFLDINFVLRSKLGEF